MNNSKKAYLAAIIPALLALYFIIRVFVPALQDYLSIREKYSDTLKTYKETLASVEELKNNRKLFLELEELDKQVADFGVQMPAAFQDEFFLADIERFSINTATSIIAMDCKKEKEVPVKNPKEKTAKKDKKNKKSKREKASEQKAQPIIIWEKPFEIKIVGHYNEALDFVSRLENYQRKVIINGITAQISKSDEKNPNPRIELAVQGSTYKVETVTLVETESESEDKEAQEHKNSEKG